MFKEEIAKILASYVRLKDSEILPLLEIPPNPELGDCAFPCFILSKKYKKAPLEIAKELVAQFEKKPSNFIEKVQAAGPYLNFFINKKPLAVKVLGINANFGRANIGKRKKIVLDFSHPNIGKPMHIGHIRSTIIGDSLMRIYEFIGYNSIGINYLGDIGLHIGKLIVAYELWLDKDALEKDPVAELLRLYVKFCANEKTQVKEGLEEEFQDNEWTNKAKDELKKLELGDKRAHKIWGEIQKASGKGFKKVYDLLNIEFTETTGQSKFSEKGKEMVINALRKGMAKQEKDGAVYVEIGDQKKYVVRSNETASYITQDIGAAVERFKKYKFEKMIYVVDFRQKAHFESLFTILKLMGYEFTDKMVHLPFGTVKFGTEIMATREGNIILLEKVLEKAIEKASEDIKQRQTGGDPEKVGVGAIKYIVLKNEPVKDVIFSWEAALSFEGNTGPYLQYSYARASSIIRKARKAKFNKASKAIGELTKEEFELVKKIALFPEYVVHAGLQMNPALIANYAFELAQLFNEFYHKCPVLGSKEEVFRLRLIDSFRTTIKNALYLLGIEVMEEM